MAREYVVIKTMVYGCRTYVVGYYNWRGKWKPVADHYAIRKGNDTLIEASNRAMAAADYDAKVRNHVR